MNLQFSSYISIQNERYQPLSKNKLSIVLKGRRKKVNCQKCDSLIVYPEGLTGEKICTNCGLVIEDMPAFKSFAQWTPEWYSNWKEEDSETLKEWLTTLRSVTCQLNIPNYPYREEAARTIRTQNHLLFKSQKLSKNKRASVAALMHLVLKEYNKMRPIKDIAKELSLDTKSVMKKAWILNKILDQVEKEPLKIKRKTSLDYLHEYSGELTQNKELILNAEKILIKLKRSGGNPIGLAAGALYFSCKEKKAKVSKEKIGQTFHIPPRTVYINEARIRKLLTRTKLNTILIMAATSVPISPLIAAF
jgi:transcription initiation factor TFIIIB Brf1 subunit/transcription initiation factor TFIIB